MPNVTPPGRVSAKLRYTSLAKVRYVLASGRREAACDLHVIDPEMGQCTGDGQLGWERRAALTVTALWQPSFIRGHGTHPDGR